MLQNKKILLGICGGIAAYKSLFLIRKLKQEGAEVKVILTRSAHDFITPLTAATLSKNPVLTEFSNSKDGTWNNHVELGLWADLMLIAPLSAHTLSKLAHGTCDNLLVASYLSARCPIMVAPAMDLDMYAHPTTVRNLNLLSKDGVRIIDAESGELASGLSGKGRMAEPENILKEIQTFFKTSQSFSQKKILITAGPTYEDIDAVRFIGNRSSGKMGLALSNEFLKRGAEVILIAGPLSIPIPEHPSLEVKKIQSADEMLDAAMKVSDQYDVAVFSAAVSDYKPEETQTHKIKKEDQDNLLIKMVENPDIALELGKIKNQGQFHVGFALETDQEERNAQNKLERKNFDMVVLNSLNDKDAGFGHETNKITIFDRDNNRQEFELKSKDEVAKDIVDEVARKIITDNS